MKGFMLLVCLFSAFAWASAEDFHCQPLRNDGNYTQTVCYTDNCANAIKTQISQELNAAFNYLYMAMHFDQVSVNRAGMAKFLYESASEERQHALLMIDYMNSRGIAFDTDYKITHEDVEAPNTLTYKNTIETALNMEIKVTDLIYKVVEKCDKDFHGADVFTNPILDEQHSGVRKLQGFLKAFNDLSVGEDPQTTALAEFIFDRKMIEGSI